VLTRSPAHLDSASRLGTPAYTRLNQPASLRVCSATESDSLRETCRRQGQPR